MATYYINADTGNDSTGTGTSANPWKTISKAHTAAASGDTIICQDSTATYTFAAQTFSKNLTIQGEQDDASGAVFDAGGVSATQWLVDTTAFTLSNVKIQNIDNSGASVRALFRFNISSTISLSNIIFDSSISIARQTIDGVYSMIMTVSSTTNITITNCTFNNIAGDTTGPSRLMGGGLVNDNVITINQSTFYYNRTTDNIDQTIYFKGGSNNTATLKNCIFHSDEASSHALSSGVTVTASYSTFSNVSSPGGPGVITGDPLFADAANGDFRLQRDSPCIATGVLV